MSKASWEFLLMVFYPYTVIKTSFLFLCIFPDSQSFTSKPNSPEYQLKGQSASLTWNFNSNGKTVSHIMWFYNNVWVANILNHQEPADQPLFSIHSIRYQGMQHLEYQMFRERTMVILIVKWFSLLVFLL